MEFLKSTIYNRVLAERMSRVILLGILLLSVAVPGYSQFLSAGIKVGAPLTDALEGYSTGAGLATTSTDRWFVGPTAEIHLPFRLSFEVDALYRTESYGITVSEGAPPVGVTLKTSLHSWQFPFLAKYDLRGGLVRPFIDGGVTYQHLSGARFIDDPNTAGVTVGGGFTVKLLFLRVSPEIRYTRWGRHNVYSPFVTNSQNQVDVLAGFTF